MLPWTIEVQALANHCSNRIEGLLGGRKAHRNAIQIGNTSHKVLFMTRHNNVISGIVKCPNTWHVTFILWMLMTAGMSYIFICIMTGVCDWSDTLRRDLHLLSSWLPPLTHTRHITSPVCTALMYVQCDNEWGVISHILYTHLSKYVMKMKVPTHFEGVYTTTITNRIENNVINKPVDKTSLQTGWNKVITHIKIKRKIRN